MVRRPNIRQKFRFQKSHDTRVNTVFYYGIKSLMKGENPLPWNKNKIQLLQLELVTEGNFICFLYK